MTFYKILSEYDGKLYSMGADSPHMLVIDERVIRPVEYVPGEWVSAPENYLFVLSGITPESYLIRQNMIPYARMKLWEVEIDKPQEVSDWWVTSYAGSWSFFKPYTVFCNKVKLVKEVVPSWK